tara:strand:- start:2383 stop:2985 length:603 start_codon:yes stop_codon:yes gene_type:complete
MRPMPPQRIVAAVGDAFEPSHDVKNWVHDTFVSESATLANETHEHLRQASIGYVWTNVENVKKGRLILGTCQKLPPTGDKWAAGRMTHQLFDWFEHIPDFLITLFAPAAADMNNRAFMALVEHELSHAAQAKDKYGMPMFDKDTGKPLWAMRGHDFEEFVGVVQRYGSTSPELAAAVAAVNDGPTIGDAEIAGACGVCLK